MAWCPIDSMAAAEVTKDSMEAVVTAIDLLARAVAVAQLAIESMVASGTVMVATTEIHYNLSAEVATINLMVDAAFTMAAIASTTTTVCSNDQCIYPRQSCCREHFLLVGYTCPTWACCPRRPLQAF